MTLTKLLRDVNNPNLLITPKLDLWLARNPSLVLSDEHANLLKSLVTSNENSDRTARFGASSRGICERSQVFTYIGIPKRVKLDTSLHNIFLDGTWRHLRWQFTLLTAGLVTDIEVKRRVEDYRLGTSVDAVNWEGIDGSGPFGLELKGAGAFTKIAKGEIPEKHLLQMHTMFIAFPELDFFIYVAEDKRYQDWKEIRVERDKRLIVAVKNELERLNDAVSNKQLPSILPECVHGKGKTFRDCPYRDRCLRIRSWSQAVEEVGKPAQVGLRRRGPKKLPQHRPD